MYELYQLNKSINSIVQPDIKCFVRKNKETNDSRVGIEYYSLQKRTAMVGGVAEGILNIGRTLYLNDQKNTLFKFLTTIRSFFVIRNLIYN